MIAAIESNPNELTLSPETIDLVKELRAASTIIIEVQDLVTKLEKDPQIRRVLNPK